jgi:sugar lactone lactonase YvrE
LSTGALPFLSALPLSLSELGCIGRDLRRPECVLTTRAGDVYTADWRGGVAHLRPDGSQVVYAAALPGGRPLRPNGIALRPDGSFLLADLGDELGGVFQLSRDSTVQPLLEEVDGVALPPSNFVHQDARGRVWITVSTRLRPRALAYRADVADGFIVLLDEQGPRVVVDGLGFTNEVVVTPDGQWLYVNETFARRLLRFRVADNGSVTDRRVITTFGRGTYPDGMALDATGAIWITSIVSNRVIRVLPDGAQQLVVEDVDQGYVDWVEEAYLTGTMGRPHLDRVPSTQLKNISSLAFGGPDLRTVFLGCLLGDQLTTFRSPLPGLPPVHWNYLPQPKG